MQRRVKDFIKKSYANRLGEQVGYFFAHDQPPTSFAGKCLPDNYLYKERSLRRVRRVGLELELDLADLVDWSIYFQLADPGLASYFSRIQTGDSVLDVGANMGFTVLRAAQAASKGSVIGFEPSLHNFEKCNRNILLNNPNNVSVHRLGVGSAVGSFYLKIRRPENRGMNQIVAQPEGNEQISVITLDGWLPTTALARVDVIKIDVEGFELEVLKGAEKTLKKYQPKIFIEVDDDNLRSQGTSASDLAQWLASNHYELFNLDGKKILDHRELMHHQDIWALPA